MGSLKVTSKKICFVVLLYAQTISPILSQVNATIEAEDDSLGVDIRECAPKNKPSIDCRIFARNWTCLYENNGIVVPDYEDEDLYLNCTSSEPLDIKITGVALKDTYDLEFVRNAENAVNEATFVYSIGMKLKKLSSLRSYTVYHFGTDPDNSNVGNDPFQFNFMKRANTFFPKNLRSYFSRNNSLKVDQLSKKFTIPCIVSNPEDTPHLKRIGVDEEEHLAVDDKAISYNFAVGFVIDSLELNKSAEGMYSCSGKRADIDDSREERMFIEVLPLSDSIISPTKSQIIYFEGESMNLVCHHIESVKMIGIFNGEKISESKAGTGYNPDLNQPYRAFYAESSLEIGDKGGIQCVKTSDESNIIHSWTFDTLDIRQNEFLMIKKKNDFSIECVSEKYGPPKLTGLHCNSVVECDLNAKCLDGTCDEKPIEGVQCSNTSSCFRLVSGTLADFQGRLKCSTTDGLISYSTTYYKGFDDILYLDWSSAPLDALVEVFTPQDITMYPQNSYPFGCRSSKFISDGVLQWVIRGKDGSEILLHKNRVNDIEGEYPLNATLHSVRQSNILVIYPNDYDIICRVPYWNSSRWIQNFKRINVASFPHPVKEILAGSGVIITLLIVLVVYVVLRLRKAKAVLRNLTDQEVEQFHRGNPEVLKNIQDKDAHEVVDSLPFDHNLEITREKLLIDNENILGSGAFGTVLKGKLEGHDDFVAIKTVNQRCEISHFKGFLSELKIMMYIGKHPNIVALIGAYIEKIKEKTLYIVVEICGHGSLESFLRNHRSCFVNQIVNEKIDTGNVPKKGYANIVPNQGVSDAYDSMLRTTDLIRWCYQIANGMKYLASKRVVHADLAARNVLIHENGCAKITDFGLSRQLFNYTMYVKKQQEPLPWRWMSLESLESLEFSTQSDVWAFGILMWEIFTLGDVPYPGLHWDITFVDKIRNGLRMTRPKYSTSALYNIMLECWREKPKDRPSFELLMEHFSCDLREINIDPEESRSFGVIDKTKVSGDNNIYSNRYTNLSPAPTYQNDHTSISISNGDSGIVTFDNSTSSNNSTGVNLYS